MFADKTWLMNLLVRARSTIWDGVLIFVADMNS
jgi:hypothetical protein